MVGFKAITIDHRYLQVCSSSIGMSVARIKRTIINRNRFVVPEAMLVRLINWELSVGRDKLSPSWDFSGTLTLKPISPNPPNLKP